MFSVRTIEDAEERLEMQSCQNIVQKLERVINDKRRRLETRRAEREADLLRRKMDFHKSVIDRKLIEA